MRGKGITLLAVIHDFNSCGLSGLGGTDPENGPGSGVLKRKRRERLPKSKRRRHLQRRVNPGKRGRWTDHCVCVCANFDIVFI